MAVYVDKTTNPYGRMIMCHMIADSEFELHEMARAIGVSRRHYQENASTPHYDICKSKRTLAIKYGAVEVGKKQLVSIIRKIRDKAKGEE